MRYSYLIIEQNPIAVKNLNTMLANYTNFINKGSASNLKDALTLVLTEKPHIIFLDVELGQENGFKLIKSIKDYFIESPYFVLTTDIDGYGKEAVNNDVLYFLDKPINPVELLKSIVKFEKMYLEKRNYITIKNSEGHFFLRFENILYIESDDNCCFFHKVNEKPQFVTRTLKDIEAILPREFIRVHKSYIINTNFVNMINTNKRKIILKTNFDLNYDSRSDKQLPNDNKNINSSNKLEIPLGESYLEQVKNALLTTKMSK